MFRRRQRQEEAGTSSATLSARATLVISDVGRELVGETCVRGRLAGTSVQSVFHYGAVDIDPRHLVVWVLLAGVPQIDLPAWWAPEAEVPTGADPDLAQWMRGLAASVRDRFESAGWRSEQQVRVMFDSAERVQQGGGWSYFK
jgi:hypothetical protein